LVSSFFFLFVASASFRTTALSVLTQTLVDYHVRPSEIVGDYLAGLLGVPSRNSKIHTSICLAGIMWRSTVGTILLIVLERQDWRGAESGARSRRKTSVEITQI
jgi:hypothetical protein